MGTPYPPGITEFDFSNELKDQIPPLFLPPQKLSFFQDSIFPQFYLRRRKIITIFQFLQHLNSHSSSETKASQLTGNFGFKSSTTALAYS